VIRNLRHEGIVDSVECLRLLFAFGHWDSLFNAPRPCPHVPRWSCGCRRPLFLDDAAAAKEWSAHGGRILPDMRYVDVTAVDLVCAQDVRKLSNSIEAF